MNSSNNDLRNLSNIYNIPNQSPADGQYLSSNQQSGPNKQYPTDDYLIEKFIGDKYHSFKTSKFNLWALVFGNLYLVYRKMFLYGLIVGIINVFINCFSVMASLVTNIILAFFVNTIYLSFAKKKVDKIKKNAITSPNSIDSLCTSKGGTSIGLVFLVIVIEVILTVIFTSVLILLNFNIRMTSKGNFNGAISYDLSTNIYDVYKISIPADFKITSDYNSIKANINTNPNELFSSCEVIFSCIHGYSSAQDFSIQMDQFYSGKDYRTKKINGITWYTFRHILGQTKDVYITEKDNKVYLYQYTTEQDANKSLCAEYNAQIINSISLK